ncbi:MAG: hypothetical protein A4E50_01455 [Methanosaeta sp. PtaB.Bin087]|nr:MAG: hypothetical protein A4E50_01455 [Methanosaeta sp. PtaB.Bin087]
MSYISSGDSIITFLCSMMSQTSKTNPWWMLGSMTRPAVLKGSAKIRNIGRLKAPGSVLSIMKATTGSAALSVNSISATPGPIPLMLPQKASQRRSWPAP